MDGNLPARRTDANLTKRPSGDVTLETRRTVVEHDGRAYEHYAPFPLPESSRFGPLKKVAVGLVVATVVATAGYFAWDSVRTNYFMPTKDARHVISEHQNPALKADKLNKPNAMYQIDKNAYDQYNGLKVAAEEIRFRDDRTTVMVRLTNVGTQTVHMMAPVNAFLTDNLGNNYPVLPFSSEHKYAAGIPAKTNDRVMMNFKPIRAEAKELTLNMGTAFDFENVGSWTPRIKFSIPK